MSGAEGSQVCSHSGLHRDIVGVNEWMIIELRRTETQDIKLYITQQQMAKLEFELVST